MTRSLEAPTLDTDAALFDIERALNSSPVIPVGPVPIDQFIDLPGDDEEVEVYAWQGTRELVVDTRRTRRDTKGPIIGLEVCSSIPSATGDWYERLWIQCGVDARRIEQVFMTTEETGRLRTQHARLLPLATAFARNQGCRDLLVAAIRRTLYEFTGDQYRNRDALRERLLFNLTKQQYAYEDVDVLDDDGIEPKWEKHATDKEMAADYLHMVRALKIPSSDPAAVAARKKLSLPRNRGNAQLVALAKQTEIAGIRSARQLIDYQVDLVTDIIAADPDHFRPVRYLSMDMLSTDKIAAHGIARAMRSGQYTASLSRAAASLGNPHQHITGDMTSKDALTAFKIPRDPRAKDADALPKGKLTYVICYDGWRPIEHHFFRKPGQLKREVQEAVMVLSGLYECLQDGGQLVVFPWSDEKHSWRERRALGRIETELGRIIHHGVGTVRYDRDTMSAWMTSKDRALLSGDPKTILGGKVHSYRALSVVRLHDSMAGKVTRSERRREDRASGRI